MGLGQLLLGSGLVACGRGRGVRLNYLVVLVVVFVVGDRRPFLLLLAGATFGTGATAVSDHVAVVPTASRRIAPTLLVLLGAAVGR